MLKIIIYVASVLFILLLTIIIVVSTNKNKKLTKTEEVLRELLPGLDCGSCGRGSCANFAKDLPGRGAFLLEGGPCPVGVLSLQGRVYMDPCDNPFEIAYEEVSKLRSSTSVILVDFHAEATAEKTALSYYLDGLVTAVVGTHTHVQTADEQILQGGTAYISDVGMTGPHNGVIGMDRSAVINKFVRCVPQKFKPAEGAAKLHAVVIEADTETGRAQSIKRISIAL